ncbi:MAG: replication initiator protein [Microviridae sp.]|nr:MAG: replication initiator protein [Microviridae sp.]
MCLYPKLIKNRKYLPNKKNGGKPPTIKDPRTAWVPVGCQKCIECKKQKARAWTIRLQEEIRTNKNGQFVTLTFSNESIKQLTDILYEENGGEEITGYQLDNEIATLATRRFLERWRKEHGKSIKHWLVTELGHNGTENIHIHGLIFTKNKKEIKKRWKYGFVFVGDYVNDKTINYISKYILKADEKHKQYQSIVLTSPGIGSNYIKRADATLNKYKVTGETKETYTTRSGTKINLPIYFRNKIYTEEERELLWLQKLDKNERWVCGSRVDMSREPIQYYELLKYHRERNARLGYGNDEKNWEQHKYEEQRRNLLIKKRITNVDTNDKAQRLHRKRTKGNLGNHSNDRIKYLESIGVRQTDQSTSRN